MFLVYAVAVVGVLLAYYYLLKDDDDTKDEPPGPRGLPILGNLLDLARASDDLTKTFGVLGEKWGEIYTIKMGSKKTVVVTSRESMQTVLSHEGAHGRDMCGMFKDRCWGKNLGLAMSEGEFWEKTKTWTFKTLKTLGFGKSAEVERYVQKSAEPFFTEIDQKMGDGGAVNIEQLFSPTVLSILWQLIVGRISKEDEPIIKVLADKGNKLVTSSAVSVGLGHAFPILRYLFPNWSGYNVQMDFNNTCHQVARNLYAESEQKLRSIPDAIPATNMLDAFVQNSANDPHDIFHCLNFQLVFMDLLVAGTDTTSTFMEASVLYLITNPDVQEKVYQEILHIAPDGRPLKFSDRQDMPYIQAFFLETHRHARTLQNALPRRALWDIKYKNYTIKRDTIIMMDMRLYYQEKKIWGDPEAFRPERFINEGGQLVNANSIISFSFGKRACPGEVHSNILTFILLTSMLQRYKISIPEGEPKPKLDLRQGFSVKPHPFRASFTKRT